MRADNGKAEHKWKNDKRTCPVCGSQQLEMFEICTCGWQNDPIQFDDPNYRGGANRMNLKEARNAFKKGIPID